MKKAIVFSFFLTFLFSISTIQAQDFKSAVGLRFGSPLSVSYKFFMNETNAIEVFAGTKGYRNNTAFGNLGWRWYSVSGAYQIHKPLSIGDIDGLQYYYGAGASAYFWTFDFDTDSNNTTFGLQLYGGVSYTFSEKPINISVDWVPTYFFNGYVSGFGAGYGSLSVRYVLSRD